MICSEVMASSTCDQRAAWRRRFLSSEAPKTMRHTALTTATASAMAATMTVSVGFSPIEARSGWVETAQMMIPTRSATTGSVMAPSIRHSKP